MPIPRVITVNDLGGQNSEIDPARYPRKYLAEGDSWFSQGAVPSSNILYEVRLPQRALILSLARPGQTLVHMSVISSTSFLKRFLTHARDTWTWDAILISGGGNDLIDKISTIVHEGTGTSPADYVDEAQLDVVVDRVVMGYRRIVEIRDARDSINRDVPIVTHTYDRCTPRNAPARLGVVPVAGPWLIEAMAGCGIDDPALRNAIADLVFDRLTNALMSLQTQLPNFRVVDTTGTLRRASHSSAWDSRDWLNEIHPNRRGYRKIAARISAEL